MNKLEENNLHTVMNELFVENKSWVEVYRELNINVELQAQKEAYSSMPHNFAPLFTYELIRQKTSLTEFDECMREIIKTNSTNELESLYSRYFNSRDADASLSEFLQKDRYNNDLSLWDNMAYVFFDKGDNKLILCKETIPYLQSLIKNIDSDKVLCLYGAQFTHFFGNFLNNPDELTPIFEVTNNNKAFKKYEEGYNKSFNASMFHIAARNSYENTTDKNKEISNFFNLNIKNYSSFIKEELINYKNDANNTTEKLIVNLAVGNFLRDIGIDIVSIINKKYLQEYSKVQLDQKNIPIEETVDPRMTEYRRTRPFEKLSSDISSSLSVMLERKDFEFSLNGLDIEGDPYKNFVYIKGLEISLKNNMDVLITKEQLEYFQDLSNKSKQEKYNLTLSFMADFESISKWCGFQNLNQQLDDSPKIQKKKPKV